MCLFFFSSLESWSYRRHFLFIFSYFSMSPCGRWAGISFVWTDLVLFSLFRTPEYIVALFCCLLGLVGSGIFFFGIFFSVLF